MLSLTEDGLTFYADSGLTAGIAYTEIHGFSVKSGAARLVGMRTLTLRRDGGPVVFKTGKALAANAAYILVNKGIPSQ